MEFGQHVGLMIFFTMCHKVDLDNVSKIFENLVTEVGSLIQLIMWNISIFHNKSVIDGTTQVKHQITTLSLLNYMSPNMSLKAHSPIQLD